MPLYGDENRKEDGQVRYKLSISSQIVLMLVLVLAVVAMQRQETRKGVKENRLCILRDFRHRPLMSEGVDNTVLKVTGFWEGRRQSALKAHESIREAFCYYNDDALKNPSFRDAAIHYPQMLFFNLYKMISCYWVAEIEDEHLELSWIEEYYMFRWNEEFQNFNFTKHIIPSYQSTLATKIEADLMHLHKHRIKVGTYHQLIKETKEQFDIHIPDVIVQTTNAYFMMKRYTGLRNDFEILVKNMERLEYRTDRTISFLNSLHSTFEGERSQSRNVMVFILTCFASFFGTLSLIASILSLASPFSPREKDFPIYWSIAIPFLILLFLIYLILLLFVGWTSWRTRRCESFSN